MKSTHRMKKHQSQPSVVTERDHRVRAQTQTTQTVGRAFDRPLDRPNSLIISNTDHVLMDTRNAEWADANAPAGGVVTSGRATWSATTDPARAAGYTTSATRVT